MLLVAFALASEPVERGLLVCADPGACAADQAWVTHIGGGGRGGFQVLDFAGAFGAGALPDGMTAERAFRSAVDDARQAVSRKRWAAALAATDEAIDALRGWHGLVPTRELFDLWFSRGVAQVELGRDQGQGYSFRQAAALLDGADATLPDGLSSKVQHAWLDETRKLVVGGKGTLQVGGGPDGTRWTVDGRPIEGGTVQLLAGNHRVTASADGRIRTWTADVPVLPGRTSAVTPEFSEEDEPTFVLDQLDHAVVALDAAESVKALLSALCEADGVEELRLMRVEQVREVPKPADVAMTGAAADRPAAAAGEAMNLGDGVPSTYEAEVAQKQQEEGERHVQETNRLRVVYFDPVTRRFSADASVSTALVAPAEHLRVGVRGAWMMMNERQHFGGDLELAVPVGPVAIDVRAGILHADEPYNFYTDWVSGNLYHAFVGARWAPSWTVAPYVGLGADFYIPMAVGARGFLGAQARFASHWMGEVEADGGYTQTGFQAGASLGVSRGF